MPRRATATDFGTAVNKAARLMSIAHGGQILVSHATEELVRDSVSSDVGLVDLGEHRLRDLARWSTCSRWLRRTCNASFRGWRPWTCSRGTCRYR